jgi:hypothetical protein
MTSTQIGLLTIRQLCHRWWTRLVSYAKCKLQERKAKKQNESPTDRAARRTAAATVWMAIFTLILATTSAFTIWILKNQLTEMHTGGQDTRTLAEAALASNRPWVGIEAIPAVRNKSAHWSIDFSVENFGNSPALHAVPSYGIENVTTPEELNKAVERHCTEGEKGTSGGEVDYVLFPGKIAWLQTQLQTAAVPGNRQNIASFIGCVIYFDQSGKGSVHHSSFCYYAKTPLVAGQPMTACPIGWSAD